MADPQRSAIQNTGVYQILSVVCPLKLKKDK